MNERLSAEDAIRAMLDRRRPGTSICPSEAARLITDNWRAQMHEIRSAAAEMAASGEIMVTQRGRVVDITLARGPVRLARRD